MDPTPALEQPPPPVLTNERGLKYYGIVFETSATSLLMLRFLGLIFRVQDLALRIGGLGFWGFVGSNLDVAELGALDVDLVGQLARRRQHLVQGRRLGVRMELGRRDAVEG